MLGADGHNAVDPAKYWHIRSVTANQHTSFSIGYNIDLTWFIPKPAREKPVACNSRNLRFDLGIQPDMPQNLHLILP